MSVSTPVRDLSPVEAAKLIASQADEIAALRRRVDDFTLHTTRDFEELTWFREMTGHLDSLDIDRDFAEVAGPILPALRELLQARTLAVVIDEAGGAEDAIDPTVLRVVGEPCEATKIARLVAGCRDTTDRGVAVLNDEVAIRRRASVRGVEACVVATMNRQPGHYGWLVAVGKMDEEEATLETCERGESRAEFGTVEATLLESAARTLATHCRNVRLFRERKELIVGIVRSMINALDAKDPYTCGHSDRVALIGRLLASELGLSSEDREAIYLSGLLHDVGKIAIPDDVLLKPGKLTDEEFEVIKRHPVTGYRMLCHLDKLKPILPGVLHHHEAWDGSGYPGGLTGTEIPRMARVMAVADAWDAMTSRRPYREAMDFGKACVILRGGRGTFWDPDVIDAFFARYDEVCAISEQAGAHANFVRGDEQSWAADVEIDSAVTAAMQSL